jgi:hypothetical protein
VIDGGCRSCTVTANEQLFVLPAASLVVQVTVFVPTLKVEPLGGAHTTATFVSQLSLAVTVNVTLLREHWPALAARTRFVEQFIVGGCKSMIATVNEQLFELPAASTTKQFTVLVPFGKVEPLGGEQTTGTGPDTGPVSDTLVISQLGTKFPRVLVSPAYRNCTATVSPGLNKPRSATLVT